VRRRSNRGFVVLNRNIPRRTIFEKKERKEAEINSVKMMVAVGHGGSGCAQSEVPPQKTL
jgi:hypothetical protein